MSQQVVFLLLFLDFSVFLWLCAQKQGAVRGAEQVWKQGAVHGAEQA